MFRRRGVTLTKALLTVVCMLAAPLTQAISVGNLTFSLPSETDFVSKRVVNNNKSARIYRIAISAIDSPGSSELRTRPVDGELLFAPRQRLSLALSGAGNHSGCCFICSRLCWRSALLLLALPSTI